MKRSGCLQSTALSHLGPGLPFPCTECLATCLLELSSPCLCRSYSRGSALTLGWLERVMIRLSRWDLKLRNAGPFPPGASLTTREATLDIIGPHHQGRDLLEMSSPGVVGMGRTRGMPKPWCPFLPPGCTQEMCVGVRERARPYKDMRVGPGEGCVCVL